MLAFPILAFSIDKLWDLPPFLPNNAKLQDLPSVFARAMLNLRTYTLFWQQQS
jgi:hypothetical protein